MNGRCSFVGKQSGLALDIERGELNDKTRPSARAGDAVVERGPGPAVAERARVVRRGTNDSVEVRVNVPHRKTKVTITIEVEPDDGPFEAAIAAPRQRPDASPRRLGDGRQLPRLVFATDPDRLGQRIGVATATQVLDQLRGEGHAVVAAARDQLLNRVRQAINATPRVRGVVLLGGYSVVPAQIVNTLPAELTGVRVRDRDRLQVWSDDGYGDRDGDGVPSCRSAACRTGKTAASSSARCDRLDLRRSPRGAASAISGGLLPKPSSTFSPRDAVCTPRRRRPLTCHPTGCRETSYISCCTACRPTPGTSPARMPTVATRWR